MMEFLRISRPFFLFYGGLKCLLHLEILASTTQISRLDFLLSLPKKESIWIGCKLPNKLWHTEGNLPYSGFSTISFSTVLT